MPSQDDRLTVAAIAVIAFVMADVAHEVVGHGAAFLLSGGRACVLTTTRLIEANGRGLGGNSLWDLGGPCGNLALAGMSWLGLRFFGKHARLSLLWWLAMAFSLFWAFGYLLFCGIVGRGDWYGLIQGRSNVMFLRTVFAAAGFLLYRASIIFLGERARWSARIAIPSYVAGGLTACAGAAFDPRGPMEMLNSGALSSFAAAVGLLWTPRRFTGERAAVARSRPWIVCAAVVSLIYIFVLGPGIAVRF